MSYYILEKQCAKKLLFTYALVGKAKKLGP
jgi:hypothetical protein